MFLLSMMRWEWFMRDFFSLHLRDSSNVFPSARVVAGCAPVGLVDVGIGQERVEAGAAADGGRT